MFQGALKTVGVLCKRKEARGRSIGSEHNDLHTRRTTKESP